MEKNFSFLHKKQAFHKKKCRFRTQKDANFDEKTHYTYVF